MKKEYTKPIVEVMTCCDSAKILSASRPEIIKVDEIEEQEGDWEVD